MDHLEKVLYTAKAHTTGARESDASDTSDGRLAVSLTSRGAPGSGTNPQEVLAVGWSACSPSVVEVVARGTRSAVPGEATIDIEVDLGLVNGEYQLAARLGVNLPGAGQETGEPIMGQAHQICLYSRATKGNIDVAPNVLGQQPEPA